MNFKYVVVAFTVLLVVSAEGRKTSRGRSSGASGRGYGRKTNNNPQPAPTSFSNPQASAPKPSLSGWQERPVQKSNTQALSSSSGQSHSYPSSNTGLSGDKPKQPATNQESIQRSSASNNFGQQQTNNQPSHSYPPSNGLSGSPGSGYPQQNANKFPQQQGSSLSGTGSQPPQYPGSGLSGNAKSGGTYPQQHGYGAAGSAAAPPPYPGHSGGYNNQNNYGNNFHPQGPPPAYSNNNYGSSYGGGYGGHGPHNPGYGSQSPGYFGNYGKGNGGVSRTGSALTGVGIAGAGIGTVLTGLALWNLARSTGQHHHTVIYDNRGQPVAVAPGPDTAPVADSILSDLLNCSLTISSDNKTEVLAIPCSIATSFTPDADIKDSGLNKNASDSTKCIITVLTKALTEFVTTIPCSVLLNTAAENNVTEPHLVEKESEIMNNFTSYGNNSTGIQNGTLTTDIIPLNEPTALRLSGGDFNDTGVNLNCTPHSGEIRDPINPCYAVNHNLTVIPLPAADAPI